MTTKPAHEDTDVTTDERRRSGVVPRTYRPLVDAQVLRLTARIQQNPQDASAVAALKQHYAEHGDLPSLANLMQGWAHRVAQDRTSADAYVEAADAVMTALGDSARAQSLYLRALQRYPQHAPALARLEAMLRERGDHVGLGRCYEQVAAALAKRSANPRLRVDIHLRFAQHLERRREDAESALAQYRAVLELEPGHAAASQGALALCLAQGNASAAAEILELQIAATDEPSDQKSLLAELARHQRDVFGDLDAAIDALERAVPLARPDAANLTWLAELLRERAERDRSHGDWARAADCYYQAARCVARNDAPAHLSACLAMRPDHWRARSMLAELRSYGAGQGASPSYAQLSQAEVDDKPTGLFALPAAPPEEASPTAPHPLPAAKPRPKAVPLPPPARPASGPPPAKRMVPAASVIVVAGADADDSFDWLDQDDVVPLDDDDAAARQQ